MTSVYDHELDVFRCNEKLDALFPTKEIRAFCVDSIGFRPSTLTFLLPTVNAMKGKMSSSVAVEFLYQLLSLSGQQVNGGLVNTSVWKELPMIPTEEELAGNLVEEDKNLRPVRKSDRYDNPEQYMDTYFRLVRAEAFSALQHGIKNLKSCTLDLRDMNVYYNLYLVGFSFQNAQFAVAIRFTPTKKVKNWKASPQLMYGNLVCISINRKFDDVIWATVSNRDEHLLTEKQIIMLTLLDENTKSVSEIVYLLHLQEGNC